MPPAPRARRRTPSRRSYLARARRDFARSPSMVALREQIYAELCAAGHDAAEAKRLTRARIAGLVNLFAERIVQRQARAALLLLAVLGDLPKGGYPELARRLGTTAAAARTQVRLLTQDARARRRVRLSGPVRPETP